jgi:hypothetical protein
MPKDARETPLALGSKTHCLRGHEFDEANTYITKSGFRSCRKRCRPLKGEI